MSACGVFAGKLSDHRIKWADRTTANELGTWLPWISNTQFFSICKQKLLTAFGAVLQWIYCGYSTKTTPVTTYSRFYLLTWHELDNVKWPLAAWTAHAAFGDYTVCRSVSIEIPIRNDWFWFTYWSSVFEQWKLTARISPAYKHYQIFITYSISMQKHKQKQ